MAASAIASPDRKAMQPFEFYGLSLKSQKTGGISVLRLRANLAAPTVGPGAIGGGTPVPAATAHPDGGSGPAPSANAYSWLAREAMNMRKK